MERTRTRSATSLGEGLRERLLGASPLPGTAHDPVLADVIRAASWLGRPATAAELGRHVGRNELEVLLALQRGADRGLRVTERDGTFALHTVSTRPPLQALQAAWQALDVAPASVPPQEQPETAEPDTRPEPESREPTDPQRTHRLSAHIAAARKAFERGQPRVAVTRTAAALAELGEATDDQARQTRCGLLADGAVYLRATDDPLALQRAFTLAQQAVDLLEDGDPIALQAATRVSLGSIAADIGSDDALDTAIDVLTQAARLLSEHDRGVDAARLLNDLAEVWMRRGDVVQATHLLRQSRAAFLEQAGTPAADLELADTEHLLARLPFHSRARPGAETDMWMAARDHALAAVERYAKLGHALDQARALETLGRILLQLRRHEEAERALVHARRVQEELGDRLGLARTANALARLLAVTERPGEALGQLEVSVELNLQLGAVAGLKHNGADLTELARHWGRDPALAPRLQRLSERLQAASELLGDET